MHHQKDFTVQELASSPSFQRMVKGSATPDEVEKWNLWIEASDENRSKAKEAISVVAGFKFSSPNVPDPDEQWSRLYAKTVGRSKQRTDFSHYQRKLNREKRNSIRWIYRAVAVFMIIGFAGAGGYYFLDSNEAVTHLEQLIEEKTIATSEGEQKTLTFSNGARVVLNSNSTLKYRLGAFQNQTIVVTLEGEAWFDAEEGSSKEEPAFAVRTPDGTVRDIGTKFLVTIQQNQSRVVLQEGIVEIEPINGYSGDSPDEKEVHRVVKGEMVEFNRTNIIKRENVNPTFFTSWATGYMELDQTGLEEFARQVEERFDVHVQLNDSALKDVALDGTVYFRSLDELVRSVSEVTGIPVYRSAEQNTIFIGDGK